MTPLSIYEFDALIEEPGLAGVESVHAVPSNVFAWLHAQCRRTSEQGDAAWLKMCQRRGRPAIQVTSFVGVIRAPDGYQIEVLPKVGKALSGGDAAARKLLVDMLCCLRGFRHIRTDSAMLASRRMPLLEVFIGEFLRAVDDVVKRGLRSDYTSRQDNLFALRGKLLTSTHLRQNLIRADRFYTEHDEYSTNRPENRLLHAALRRALTLSKSQANQQFARQLCFVFADVPEATQVSNDFQRVRLDRGMSYYEDSLAWAKLILESESPVTGVGAHSAPSLLFPMEALFEAFVAKHLPKQLIPPRTLTAQARSQHLVQHREQNWFRLKPDLLIRESHGDTLVLDTKWKLLDGQRSSGTDKYGLSQSDFYQMYAYGHSYLDGKGDVVLIYPKTDAFAEPLPVFEFPKPGGLRLWVVPFCLSRRTIQVPPDARFADAFKSA